MSLLLDTVYISRLIHQSPSQCFSHGIRETMFSQSNHMASFTHYTRQPESVSQMLTVYVIQLGGQPVSVIKIVSDTSD